MCKESKLVNPARKKAMLQVGRKLNQSSGFDIPELMKLKMI